MADVPEVGDPQAAPPVVPAPRPRWWSPRRAWLPLLLSVLLAAGVGLYARSVAADRRNLEARAADVRDGIADLRDEIAEGTEAETTYDELVERQRANARHCVDAARTGVRFLHGMVRSLALAIDDRFDEANDERRAMNRLIREANIQSRRCQRGL